MTMNRLLCDLLMGLCILIIGIVGTLYFLENDRKDILTDISDCRGAVILTKYEMNPCGGICE